MNYRAFSAILIFIFTFAFSVYAQIPTAETTRRIEEAQRRRETQDRERRSYELDKMTRQGLSQEQTVFQGKEIAASQLRAFRKLITAPAVEDIAANKDFLKQRNTGIFRLFPDRNCSEKGIARTGKGCEEAFPDTWFYSFRKKDYSDGLFFDLSLKDGKLYSDGFLALGILVRLGNFSLEKVGLESGGAKFLTGFSPFTKASDLNRQREQIGKGIEADGYTYSREVKAELGEVYLLRVVAYDVPKKLPKDKAKNGETITDGISLAGKDERKDITVAFRIIRISKTGDLTIIWKELNKRKSPEVIFSN